MITSAGHLQQWSQIATKPDSWSKKDCQPQVCFLSTRPSVLGQNLIKVPKRDTFLKLWIDNWLLKCKSCTKFSHHWPYSEKILGEMRLNLTFHSENTKCDLAYFNMLIIFSISCLNSGVSLDVHRWQKIVIF